MVGRISNSIAILLVAVAAGCGGSAPSRFYTLDSTAVSDGPSATVGSVMVGPVSIPASVDRSQFVVQVAPNRVQVEEFNRWASPLNDSIARAIAGDLVTQLGNPDVVAGTLANLDPTYRVTIDIQRFESVPGKTATIEAVWVVRKSTGGATRSGRTVASESVQGNGFDALAAAHSRALARVSGDIAAAIRSEASQKS
jgi:uncharacterized lipoprotein YmbA